MASKVTIQDVISCSAYQGLLQYNFENITSTTVSRMVRRLFWGEKVLIREIWLHIYLTEMHNNNRKLIAHLISHLLDNL